MTAAERTFLDDLGAPVRVPAGGPQRIVSLVPSLTEAIATTLPDRLVGATDWCIRPTDLRVTRVRGTKNPDRAAIAGLQPDLVVCNQEENRRLDVDRLRERGIPVWVTAIESVEQAITSMRRLFAEGLGVGEPGWLVEAARAWEVGSVPAGRRRPSGARPRVAIAIWRDPWMVVGPRTYPADLFDRLGFDNAFGDAVDRYPHVEVAAIRAAADLVVLPDEPYAFGPDDGPEAFRGGVDAVPTVCVDGCAITWYGPAMVGARAYLEDVLAPWRR